MSGTQSPPDPNAPGWFGQTGQGLAGAIMAPQTQALLGLAGGLAQAAMPSRMKIPLGVAIADGAQGMSQGIGNSYAMQKTAMDNQMQAARLPLFQQMIAGQLRGGGGMGAPFGVPSPMGGGGAASPGVSGGVSSAVSGAVTSPAALLGQVPTYAALGMDGLATQSMKGALEMAGGTGYTPLANGGSTYTPGSGQDPNVMFRNQAAAGWGGAQPKLAENGLQLGPNGTIVPMPGYIGAKAAQAGAEAQATVGPALAKEGLTATPAGIVPTPGYQAASSGNAAATSAGTAAGKAPYDDPVTYEAVGPNGQAQKFTIPRTTYAQGAGSGNAPSAAMPAATYAAKVSGLESSNNPNAQNPGSTAAGPAQFTDGTWNAFLQSQHPELLQTANPASLKSIPSLAQEGTIWLGRQNAGVLAQAGAPVNASTLALAHHVGGQGAVDVLSAPPNTPLAAIPSLQPAMARDPRTGLPINPDMQGQTAGSFAGNYLMRFGRMPVDLSGGVNGAPAQGPLGGVPGQPIMTDEQKAISAQYGAQAASVVQAAAKAPVGMQKLDVIANAAKAGFTPDAFGSARLAALKNVGAALQQIGVTPPAWIANGAAAGETIGKEGTQLAADMTKSLGSREAASVLNRMISVMPNVSMSKGGFQAIVSGLRQGLQRDQDIGAFQEAWLQSHPSVAGMQRAFDSQNPPEVYASRVVPFPQPKTGGLLPNVYYRNAAGSVALWDGTTFKPVGS